MIHDPCEFDFENEGTNIDYEHEVIEENITSVGRTHEWSCFRDNLAERIFDEWRMSSSRQ